MSIDFVHCVGQPDETGIYTGEAVTRAPNSSCLHSCHTQARRSQEAAAARAEGLSARVEELECDLDDALQRCESMHHELDEAVAGVSAASSARKMADELQIEVERLQRLLEAAEESKVH
jgi:hypothetical protein